MQTSDLSSFNNSWYKPGKNGFVRMLWYFTNIFVIINPLNPLSICRVWSLRLFGARIGKGVVIKPGVNIKYPWRLTIGDNSWIGENAWIDNLGKVTIGQNVCISQGAMLLCGNHDYTRSSFDLMISDITLEDGSWLGARSVVVPGVTVGTHAVLSVNSTATKNLEAWKIYQGTPALPIRDRIIVK
jgi:putative colanic acid biosynthesis acetyltransferase WcaF